jgi:hypothetical protein
MQGLEITWWRVFRIYWLFIWRAVVGAAIIGGIMGAILGVVAVLAGIQQNQLAPVIGASALIIGVVWSLVAMRMMLRKQYKDFRIVLVPPASTQV